MDSRKNTTICPSCQKTNARPPLFCSDCGGESALYHEIQIPKLWAKRVSSSEKEVAFRECADFADRHKYKLWLILLKLRIKFDTPVDLSVENKAEIQGRGER